MAAIVNTALVGTTITYNGWQIGGSESQSTTVSRGGIDSTPPTYSLRGSHVWDDAGRAVIATDYVLEVVTVLFESTEAALAGNMAEARKRLSVHGQVLSIAGLGTGFGRTVGGLANVIDTDINYGPKPTAPICTPLGYLAWELRWSISFRVISSTTVISPYGLAPIWLAFNYETTWKNDFEGMCERTISGYIQIPQHINSPTPKTVIHIAEETRGNLVVLVPSGFRRTMNVWREGADKSRLDFTIVDEQLPGDSLPAGISQADGAFSFTAGGDKPGVMNKSTMTLTASFKSKPGAPRNLPGQLFLNAAISKQGEIQQGLTGGSIIFPVRLSITNGKWDRARQTDCSISWIVAGCLGNMLTAAGIWNPIGFLEGNDYAAWKASMDPLWVNRGVAGLTGNIGEAVIIDLGSNVTSKTIGQTNSNALAVSAASLPSLTCPNVPKDGGWIIFDLDIRIHREDNQSWHKKAAVYNPPNGQVYGGTGSDTTPIGAPAFTQSPNDADLVEYHGYPDTLIGLRFKGLRFKNLPEVPQIKTVAGLPVVVVSASPSVAKPAFDSFGCPVWYIEGTRVYRVNGYIPSTKPTGSLASCGANTVPTDQ